MLYARTTRNDFGTLDTPAAVRTLFRGGRTPQRMKPTIYTYVICMDGTLRFSETGAAFFVDFASKHALHANCAESVWYSGEFHPRPVGGWEGFAEGDARNDAEVGWELVVDNNSGTYAPDKGLLPQVGKLMECNFVGFRVVALDREDEALERSKEACRAYAVQWRAERRGELHLNKHQEGEQTLNDRASVESHDDRDRGQEGETPVDGTMEEV